MHTLNANSPMPLCWAEQVAPAGPFSTAPTNHAGKGCCACGRWHQPLLCDMSHSQMQRDQVRFTFLLKSKIWS